MIACVSFWLLFCTAPSTAGNADPVVTLNHGGQLRGLRRTYQETRVDVFLGVRYAQPPLGKLRFKKPEPMQPWQGAADSVQHGHFCVQFAATSYDIIGNEDCLHLDITVPGGVDTANRKPVMVWIHGGSYQKGSARSYVGAALAVTGDVIVVALNYRVGVFGFLSDGPGTGNYGLWDQRAALLWVKENIEQFGGDPELVTIFGESAGGGSVAAQTMGKHNDALFKRAIQQSGSLFTLWGWTLSKDLSEDMNTKFRKVSNCPPTTKSVHDCLSKLPAEEIYENLIGMHDQENPFHPVADGDFFHEDITIHSYKPTERFDLMSGFSGQEGVAVYVTLLTWFSMAHDNVTFMNGMSNKATNEFLLERCSIWYTPLAPHLCVEFLKSLYQLTDDLDDQERAKKLVDFFTEDYLTADIVFGLQQRKTIHKSTYAYYFTELFLPASEYRLWPNLDWAKTMADHTDELPFLFGTAFLKDEPTSFWTDLIKTDPLLYSLMLGATEGDKQLSLTIMRLWSNFAKSGNPNKPEKLPEGIPTWPEFNTQTDQFLEINSKRMQVVTTPNIERIDKLRQLLHTDRDIQYQATHSQSEMKKEVTHDEL